MAGWQVWNLEGGIAPEANAIAFLVKSEGPIAICKGYIARSVSTCNRSTILSRQSQFYNSCLLSVAWNRESLSPI